MRAFPKVNEVFQVELNLEFNNLCTKYNIERVVRIKRPIVRVKAENAVFKLYID